MKTSLPPSITTVEEAKKFLHELTTNGEAYHPDDRAEDISFEPPITRDEADKLNHLMDQVLAVPDFDPYGYLIDLEVIYQHAELTFIGNHIEFQVMDKNITGVLNKNPHSGNLEFIPDSFYEKETEDFYNEYWEDIETVIISKYENQ